MYVHGSTHRKGHTLYVLLTRCTDEHLVRNVAITDMGISDHSAIKFISAARCYAARTKIKYQKLRIINADIFPQDIPVLRPEDIDSLSVDGLYAATLVNLAEIQKNQKNPAHWKRPEKSCLLPRTVFLTEIITQSFPHTSHNPSWPRDLQRSSPKR